MHGDTMRAGPAETAGTAPDPLGLLAELAEIGEGTLPAQVLEAAICILPSR